MELLHKDITDKIIRTFYKVYNELGYGFLEKVYQNALVIELAELGLFCEKQIKVYYKKQLVGEYFADIMVNNSVIIELKAGEGLVEAHEFQLINYLKSTELEVGILLNFGKQPIFKRKIFTNKNKNLSESLNS
jgi:GxxExxY protein